VFDEDVFLRRSGAVSEEAVAALCDTERFLSQKYDMVFWFTQFDDLERIPSTARSAVRSFWDHVYVILKGKPVVLVNMPSARRLKTMGIGYERFLHAFANAVKVDYGKLRKTGSSIAYVLDGKKHVHVCDANGTDLAFSIEGRRVGIEVGTLEDCFRVGRNCEVELPAGEVYVAPLECSANGRLFVDELKNLNAKKIEMRLENGRIIQLRAEKGAEALRRMLDDAKGDKDRIAELGIGINDGLKPVGWSVFDEKALGTSHLAIGDNLQLGGSNRASIHVDLVLYNPTIIANSECIMEKGKLQV
jgi:leucyl aminopeptidase (aminopeptidase T)